MKKASIILSSVGVLIIIISVTWYFCFNNYNRNNLFNEYYQGNYKRAFEKLLPQAKAGDLSAQVNIANLYKKGLGVSQNLQKAFYWYSKASDSGNVNGTLGLALMYNNGEYVQKNLEKAIILYRRVIKQNNSSTAQYNLSLIYLNDKKEFYNEGIKLLAKSAEQNDPSALTELGTAYYTGMYNKKIDYKRSFKMLKKAADAGYSVGQNNLAVLYYQGKAIKKDDYKAYFWFYIASEYGNYDKSKELINAYSFNLTNAQKNKAEKEADQWIKSHREINTELATSN